MTKVVFPCDRETWWKVKDGLHNLKDMCLQNGDLTTISEAHQAIVNINLDIPEEICATNNCVFYGLVKYFRKHASAEEKSAFLAVTLPNIIDLALQIESLLPTEGITISHQQKGETRHIERRLCCSILACAFLCLFPNEQRGFRTKLNTINFNKFFASLPLGSQNAKLLCILHFFERVTKDWDRLTGSVVFTRQVMKWEELPTLDTWLNCSTRLCQVKVFHDGKIEDAGPHCLEVDFANKYIGGGVLGRGRVQEEIRFTVCPELIVAMLFMEVMDDNEAIIIRGYEQFSLTEGYAASLKYVGPYMDTAEVGEDGNLVHTLCAIDAVSYRHDPTGQGREQYEDGHLMRDINKAFIGFLLPFSRPQNCISEEDYFTADEEEVESDTPSDRLGSAKMQQIDRFVDNLLKQAISLAIPEAVTGSNASINRITPKTDSSIEPPSQTLHGISEDPHMSHLDVSFRDWYAHYRRRSSNLSDLSSRRSSYDLASRCSSACSNRGYSSEFSSEFEEYYDNFVVQEQRYKYQTIKEEVGTSVINEFAAGLAASLLKVGTLEAVHKDSDLRDFRSEQPSNVVNKPRPVRMSAERELVFDQNMNEVSARKFVDYMFQGLWPFDNERTGVEEISDSNTERTEVLDRIIEGCNTVTHTLQNSEDDSEICETENERCVEEEENVEVEASNNRILIVDENMLFDIADRIVTVAMEEGLAEFRYRYSCAPPRKLLTQISSESSQSEHSIDTKDQSDASKQAQDNQSDLSNRSDGDNKYSLPAVTVAENLVSEIFKQDLSRGKAVAVPIKTDCDSEKTSIYQPSQQYGQHSTNESDNKKQKLDRKLEMYNKIAERLLQGEFESRSADLQPGQVDDAIHNSKSDSAISLDVTEKHDHMNGQSQTVDFSSEILQQDVSECAFTDTSQTYESVIPANKSPNSLSAFIESGKSLSRSGSEKSKSSRLSEKRSSSGSSEGKSAMNQGSHSLSVYSKDGDSCGKISPENSNTSANQSNHSTGSDKTGSESSVQKFKVTGPRFCSSPVEAWQGARPKTNLKVKNSHHIVGSKKNYDQFANSLSRDLLTNAFLQVQEHKENVCYPRRSSEPMQISNGAALQRLENSVHICNGRRTQKSKTDEDLREFEDNWPREGSFTDVRYGKNSSGFRDPLLSRFAEELMKANVSVPQLQLLTDCVSTSGSSRSVCSTVSSFKDPLLASFEEELLNSNGKAVAKTQMSWSKMKAVMSSPRLNERHAFQNSNYCSSYQGYSLQGNNFQGNGIHGNSNDNSNSRKNRVNSMSVESEMSNLSLKSNRSISVLVCSREMADFAEMLARRILCEALTAAVCGESDSRRNSRSRMTLDMYSEMLAGSIIRSAMSTVENEKLCSDWLEQNKMSHGPIVTWSDETECLEYSGEDEDEEISNETDTDIERLSQRSGGSSSLEYEDCLDIPYPRLEQFADLLAARVLVNSVAVMKREKDSTLRKQYGLPIATGNWGCGAFGGDPQLKSLLQWMAASYAGAPELLYYTFRHPGMARFQDVIDTITYRGWDVAQLMQAVRRYCISTENEIRLTGSNSRDLFDVIIQGEVFPGT